MPSKCTCRPFIFVAVVILGSRFWFHYRRLVRLTSRRPSLDTRTHTEDACKLTAHFAQRFLLYSRDLAPKPKKMTHSGSRNQVRRKSVMVWRSFTPVLITKWQNSFFLDTVRNVLQVSFQRHMCEPVQRDLTRALQGEGNKTRRDEANILILLS